MAPQITDQKWYSIAEQASKEMDSPKSMVLVALLCSGWTSATEDSKRHMDQAQCLDFPCQTPDCIKRLACE